MRKAFKHIRFSPEKLDLIDTMNSIIDEYQRINLRLTLRQLYYQLVSRDVIPNDEKSYKRVGSILSDARIAGHVDWDAIEDRARQPVIWSDFTSVTAAIEQAINQFRLPRWRGQQRYVELWVEKDALANVLRPIAAKWHVTLMVNRGYSSSSAMYEAAMRFRARCGYTAAMRKAPDGLEAAKAFVTAEVAAGRMRHGHVLYLGDHDPSGEDMVRDVNDRLALFGAPVHMQKIALTMAQVRQYNPPPNPAKVTDSRAKGYIEKFGTSSWEVDALPPNVLTRLIEDEIKKLVNVATMNKIKALETQQEEAARDAASAIDPPDLPADVTYAPEDERAIEDEDDREETDE